jgi:phosphoglycerate dehydrogenase-like enzyme
VTRVLLTPAAVELVRDRLQALGVEPVVLGDASNGRATGFDVAWATSDLYGDADLARHFFGAVLSSETLRWLQVSNAGVDHPVFAQIAARGVTLTTSHVTGVPIAEYVIRAVLDHFQRAGEWRASIAEGRWEVHEFREVAGTTWLVVGLGAIGSAVAARARALGATVLGVRRNPTGDEPVDELVDLSAAGRADVVVLAVPATAATRGMVDDAFLAGMRRGSVLVNVGRGALVDEEALLRALDGGTPEAALLDVTTVEPPPADSPLWTHPRVTLTPHSSALGSGRHARAAGSFLDNLEAHLAGAPLAHVVTDEDLAG